MTPKPPTLRYRIIGEEKLFRINETEEVSGSATDCEMELWAALKTERERAEKAEALAAQQLKETTSCEKEIIRLQDELEIAETSLETARTALTSISTMWDHATMRGIAEVALRAISQASEQAGTVERAEPAAEPRKEK